MPSFLSKVFGRTKKSSSGEGEREDKVPASPLGGKFEAVSLSPSTINFHNSSSASAANNNNEKQSNGARQATVRNKKKGGNGASSLREVKLVDKNDAPHLSLNLPGPKDERGGLLLSATSSLASFPSSALASRGLGAVFEADPDERVLVPENMIGEKRLSPLETLVLVKTCGQAITARGLETLGLMHPHWYSASPEIQRRLISLFIQSLSPNSPITTLSPTPSSPISTFESEIQYTRDPHDVAAVFRWGIRHLQLASSSFGKQTDWYHQFLQAERTSSYPPRSFSQHLAPLVPPAHLELLKATLDVIMYIAAHAEATGISGSKLTKMLGAWLLNSALMDNSEKADWAAFYANWETSARMLEHLFLADIRDEAATAQMPLRLTQLVNHYPSGEPESTEPDMFPRPKWSTRRYKAILVRLESETTSTAEKKGRSHPLKLINDALKATSEEGFEPDDMWARVKKNASSESAPFSISRIFADETIRLISLVPVGPSSAFNGGGGIFDFTLTNPQPRAKRRRSFSLNDGQTSRAANGSAPAPESSSAHVKASSSIDSTSTARPSLASATAASNAAKYQALGATDWATFSKSGFDLGDSTLGTQLAATLMDKDVEVTTPPLPLSLQRKKSAGSRKTERKSWDASAVQTPRDSVPGTPAGENVPDVNDSTTTATTTKYKESKLVEVDEAFIDFWADALTDPISAMWPSFVVGRLKRPVSVSSPVAAAAQGEGPSKVEESKVEWVIIEQTFVKPTPPLSPVPPTIDTNVPSTGVTTGVGPRIRPASPKPSFRSDISGSLAATKKRFSLFSLSSTSGVSRKSGSGAFRRSNSKPRSRGQKAKVGEMGEIMDESDETTTIATTATGTATNTAPTTAATSPVTPQPHMIPIPETPVEEKGRLKEMFEDDDVAVVPAVEEESSVPVIAEEEEHPALGTVEEPESKEAAPPLDESDTNAAVAGLAVGAVALATVGVVAAAADEVASAALASPSSEDHDVDADAASLSRSVAAAAAEKFHDKQGNEAVVITSVVSSSGEEQNESPVQTPESEELAVVAEETPAAEVQFTVEEEQAPTTFIFESPSAQEEAAPAEPEPTVVIVETPVTVEPASEELTPAVEEEAVAPVIVVEEEVPAAVADDTSATVPEPFVEEQAPVEAHDVEEPESSLPVVEDIAPAEKVPAPVFQDDSLMGEIPEVVEPAVEESAEEPIIEAAPAAEEPEPATEEFEPSMPEAALIIEEVVAPGEEPSTTANVEDAAIAKKVPEVATSVPELVVEEAPVAAAEPSVEEPAEETITEIAPTAEESEPSTLNVEEVDAPAEEPSAPADIEDAPTVDETPVATSAPEAVVEEASVVAAAEPAVEELVEETVTEVAPAAEESEPSTPDVEEVAAAAEEPIADTEDAPTVNEVQEVATFAAEPDADEPAEESAVELVPPSFEEAPASEPSAEEPPVEASPATEQTPLAEDNAAPEHVVAEEPEPAKGPVVEPATELEAAAFQHSEAAAEEPVASPEPAVAGAEQAVPEHFELEQPTIEPLHVTESQEFTSNDSFSLPAVPVVDSAPDDAAILIPTIEDDSPARADEAQEVFASPSAVDGPAGEILALGETPGPELSLSPKEHATGLPLEDETEPEAASSAPLTLKEPPADDVPTLDVEQSAVTPEPTASVQELAPEESTVETSEMAAETVVEEHDSVADASKPAEDENAPAVEEPPRPPADDDAVHTQVPEEDH